MYERVTLALNDFYSEIRHPEAVNLAGVVIMSVRSDAIHPVKPHKPRTVDYIGPD